MSHSVILLYVSAHRVALERVIQMKVKLHTTSGSFQVRIKNVTSLPLSEDISISSAEYLHTDGAVVFLEFGDDLELVRPHSSLDRAKAHASHIKATYDKSEGVQQPA